MKQANDPLPPPRTLNPKLPAAFETVLLKALTKEPSARYQSAAEFATALRKVQAVAAARPIGNLPKTPPKKARPPLLLAAIGVFTVAIITFLALMRLDNGMQQPTLAASVPAAGVAVAALPTGTPTPNATTVAHRVTTLPTDTTDALTVPAPLTGGAAISGVDSTPPLTTAEAAIAALPTVTPTPSATTIAPAATTITTTHATPATGATGATLPAQSDRGRRHRR